jgi:hypothetical protein
MLRSTDVQKAERLNAAHRLLSRGMNLAEATLTCAMAGAGLDRACAGRMSRVQAGTKA